MLAGFPPFFDDTPFGTYEKILAAKINFPSHFTAASKDLLRQFLIKDPTKRLGNLRGGCQDIKQHPWFYGVDWEALMAGKIRPPIQPLVTKESDARNFDSYKELSVDEIFGNAPDPYRFMFADF